MDVEPSSERTEDCGIPRCTFVMIGRVDRPDEGRDASVACRSRCRELTFGLVSTAR